MTHVKLLHSLMTHAHRVYYFNKKDVITICNINDMNYYNFSHFN